MRATRSKRRGARVRLVHSRRRLTFLRKIMAATSFVETTVVFRFFLSFHNNFAPLVSTTPGICEASLKIVGFVLLHKVPKEKTDRRLF